MKTGRILALCSVLFGFSMVFAAGESSYYNVVRIKTGSTGVGPAAPATYAYFLTQDAVPCTSANWTMDYTVTEYNGFWPVTVTYVYRGGMNRDNEIGYESYGQYSGSVSYVANGNCLESLTSTPQNLYDLVKKHWVDPKEDRSFKFGSDIDLGEISTEEGKCKVNHVPLPFRNQVGFNGGGHTVRNLCYVSDEMTKPMGLFERVDSADVRDIVLKDVRVIVKGGAPDGSKYFPVGSLTGVVTNSYVANVTLRDVSIEAPFAGGALGLSVNSTLENITATDDILITNSQPVTEGVAGSETVVRSSYGNVEHLKVHAPAGPYSAFLGGVIGVAIRTNDDMTIQDGATPKSLKTASIRAIIKDYAQGHRSAVGGAVGMVNAGAGTSQSMIADSIVNVSLKKLSGSKGENLKTEISGGSAMGGIVGYLSAYFSNGGPIPGGFVIKDCQFDGEITKGAEVDTIAVGGIVGHDYTQALMSMRIENCQTNVDVVDSLAAEGSFGYFAGGILGYGNNCTNSQVDDDYVNIVGSSANGNITVAASGSTVKNLHVKAFLGGIAGTACIAAGANGLNRDTASVNITSNIKTGLNDGLLTNGQPSYDSLTVGGILGAMNNATSVELSDLVYTGKITINDSLLNIRAGGIVGAFIQREGGKSVSFNNVSAERSIMQENLIAYTSAISEKSTATTNEKTVVLGGLCGLCNTVKSFDNARSIGKISVKGEYAGDSLYVGGLLGNSYNVGVEQDLRNSYTIGKMDISADAGKKLLGYLSGSIFLSETFKIHSCYHYGDDDVDAFGVLHFSGSEVADWKTLEGIQYVVRKGDRRNWKEEFHNGTETEDFMMSIDFAGFLDNGYEPDNYVWNSQSGKNFNLPFVVTPGQGVKPGSLIPVYEVSFVMPDGNPIGDVQWVEKNSSAVAPDVPEVDGMTFAGWDGVFSDITSDKVIKAVYVVKKVNVSFYDYNENFIDIAEYDYGSEVVKTHSREATVAYTYTFKGWKAEGVDTLVRMVYSDVKLTAVYDSSDVKYYVVFKDLLDKKQIGDTVWVKYGEAADAPELPIHEGYEFLDWTDATDKVVSNMIVFAEYKAVASSSSSVPESSSSSIAPESSSSSVESKETLIVHDVEFVKSGLSAVKVSFGADNLDPEADSKIYVSIVDGDEVVADSTFEYSKVSSVSDVWEVILNRVGSFDVKVSVVSGSMEQKIAVADRTLEIKPMMKTVKNSWNMISVAAVKTDMNEVLKKNHLYYWDETKPIGDYWQYRAYKGGDTDPSRGFWFGSPDGDSLVFDIAYTGDKDAKISWALDSAYSGWNLVANPYGWDISLEEGRTNDGSEVTFWKRSAAGGYDPATTIGAYEAVWVNVKKRNSDSIVWEVDAKPYFNTGDSTEKTVEQKIAALRKSALRKASSNNWSLLAVLSDDNGRSDSWNVIGAGATAETLAEPPTGMGDVVTLSVRENGKALAKSVKTVADEYEWTLNVNASSNREGKLSFEGLKELQNVGLRLFVTVDGVTSEVKAGETVKVALTKSTKQVGVRVASAPKAVAVASQVKGFRAVKVADGLQMQFETTGDLAGAASHYALVDVKGKVVASGNFSASAGNNSISVAAPKAGVYFMKLKVGSQMSSAKVLVK